MKRNRCLILSNCLVMSCVAAPPERGAAVNEPSTTTAALPADVTGTSDTADTSTHLTDERGDGVITDPCEHGETGPRRDCGYVYRGLSGCLVGEDVPYDFGPDPTLELQALRVCRATSSEGVPCTFEHALDQTVGWNVWFRCPPLVPGGDPDAIIGGNGGGFSVYTAETWE